MENGLRVKVDGAVATVTLTRPQVHNALDDAAIANLTQAFQKLGVADAVRVVVLESEGKSFCAGLDVAWVRRGAESSREDGQRDAMQLAVMIDAIDRCPKPVVAVVQGAALGGGVGLVAAADIVLAAEEASFALTEVRLGLEPTIIGPQVLAAMGALFFAGVAVAYWAEAQGNPALKPVKSKNLDLSYEWYYGQQNFISLGYFRKNLENYAGQTQINATPFNLHTPVGGKYWNAALANGCATADTTCIRNYIFRNFAGQPGVVRGNDDAITGNANGVITVVGNHEALRGTTSSSANAIALTPLQSGETAVVGSTDGGKTIAAWRCGPASSNGLPVKYLPASCKAS
jgi:hypothetical protein